MIEMEMLVSGYGRESVLDGVSAEFKEGELTVLIGKNGCGKTTLFKTLIGTVKPLSGRVMLDGVSLFDMKPTERARAMAYLAQSRSVPDMTAFEAVLHGRFAHLSYPRIYSSKDKELAFAAMERAGIAEYAAAPMWELSGGMRQRVFIAMALCQDARYILLDEPFTFLDVAGQLELVKSICSLAADGRGVVAVMHDLAMAFTFADKIVVMENGRITYSGIPAAMLTSGIAERVFGVSLMRHKDGTYGYKY